jgi:DNA-binding IclR family transcriptional regulator
VRGRILKALVDGSAMTAVQIVRQTGMDAERVRKNLDQLAREGFLVSRRGRYSIE